MSQIHSLAQYPMWQIALTCDKLLLVNLNTVETQIASPPISGQV